MSNRAESQDLIELGNRIRDRRQELRLSQEKIAEKAGISVNTVSRIEGGQSAMSIEIFIKLVQILEVDANELNYSVRINRLRRKMDSARRYSAVSGIYNKVSRQWFYRRWRH